MTTTKQQIGCAKKKNHYEADLTAVSSFVAHIALGIRSASDLCKILLVSPYLDISHELVIAVEVNGAEFSNFIKLEGKNRWVWSRVVPPTYPG